MANGWVVQSQPSMAHATAYPPRGATSSSTSGQNNNAGAGGPSGAQPPQYYQAHPAYGPQTHAHAPRGPAGGQAHSNTAGQRMMQRYNTSYPGLPGGVQQAQQQQPQQQQQPLPSSRQQASNNPLRIRIRPPTMPTAGRAAASHRGELTPPPASAQMLVSPSNDSVHALHLVCVLRARGLPICGQSGINHAWSAHSSLCLCLPAAAVLCRPAVCHTLHPQVGVWFWTCSAWAP